MSRKVPQKGVGRKSENEARVYTGTPFLPSGRVSKSTFFRITFLCPSRSPFLGSGPPQIEIYSSKAPKMGAQRYLLLEGVMGKIGPCCSWILQCDRNGHIAANMEPECSLLGQIWTKNAAFCYLHRHFHSVCFKQCTRQFQTMQKKGEHSVL